MRKDLEKRLIRFSVMIIDISKSVSNDYMSTYMINQLLRSSASAALNYGEAQGAESKKDFIHKISIVLKELRETNVNLKILTESELMIEKSKMEIALDESNQLVSIFYKAVITAKKTRGNK